MSPTQLDNRSQTKAPRTLAAVCASLVSIPLGLVTGAAPATAAPVPAPPTKPMPDAIDIAPKYQEGTRCLSGDRPGVTAFAGLLNSVYGRHIYGINRTCAAEHGEGRALDWMLDAGKQHDLDVGNTITRWLSANNGEMARRFGINYIIWNRQMWRAYDPGRGWATYGGSSPHTDHIHFSFTWDGAYQRTSWWTGKALSRTEFTGPKAPDARATPPPASGGSPLSAYAGTRLQRGASGAAVSAVQRAIGGIAVDGRYGPATEAAVRRYQSAHGIPTTGVVARLTWAALVKGSPAPPANSTRPPHQGAQPVLRIGARGEAVKVLQRALGGIAVDGRFGPATDGAVRGFQARHGLAVDGSVGPATWGRLGAGASNGGSLAAYSGTVLKRGSQGAAVAAVQRKLGITADGRFGPATEAAVKAAQRRFHIASTGVVATLTWRALTR